MTTDTTAFMLSWLEKQKTRFQGRLDRLALGKEEDDIDRLMDSEEHWQAMIDLVNATKRHLTRNEKPKSE